MQGGKKDTEYLHVDSRPILWMTITKLRKTTMIGKENLDQF